MVSLYSEKGVHISANFVKVTPSTQMQFSQIPLNHRITTIVSIVIGNPVHFTVSWKLSGTYLHKYKWERSKRRLNLEEFPQIREETQVSRGDKTASRNSPCIPLRCLCKMLSGSIQVKDHRRKGWKSSSRTRRMKTSLNVRYNSLYSTLYRQ